MNLDVSDIVDDKNVVKIADDVDHSVTSSEAEQTEKALEKKLTESDISLDDETFAYIDEINPDIDLDELSKSDEEIDKEQENEDDVQGSLLLLS